MTIYNINTINSLISKEFARFLKDNNIYIDYVRNFNSYNDEVDRKITDITDSFSCHPDGYISGAFLWGCAKYPSAIKTHVEMRNFWTKMNDKWLKILKNI